MILKKTILPLVAMLLVGSSHSLLIAQQIDEEKNNHSTTDTHQLINKRAGLRIIKNIKKSKQAINIYSLTRTINKNSTLSIKNSYLASAMLVDDQTEDDSDEGDTGGSGESGGDDAGGSGGGGNGNVDPDPVSTGDPNVDAQIDAEADAALADSVIDQAREGTSSEPLNQNKLQLTWYGCKMYIDSRGATGIVNNLGFISVLTGIAPEPVLTKIWSGEMASWAYLIAQANRDNNGVVIYCIVSPITGYLYPQFVRPQ